MSEKKCNERTRVWNSVYYPESLPENWLTYLDDQHLSFAVSPLHDKDKNADGTVKKAHFHLIFVFDGPKSFDQVNEINSSLGQPIPVKAMSLRGSVRYLIHLDNPEKYQYKKSDIRCYGGFNADDYFLYSVNEKHELLRDIFGWILDNNIRFYSDLLIYSYKQRPDWYDLLVDNYTLVLREFFFSSRKKQEEMARAFSLGTESQIISDETGEVI